MKRIAAITWSAIIYVVWWLMELLFAADGSDELDEWPNGKH